MQTPSEIEKQLLGHAMVNPAICKKVSDYLEPEDFFYQDIAETIISAHRAGKVPTIAYVASMIPNVKEMLMEFARLYLRPDAVDFSIEVMINKRKEEDFRSLLLNSVEGLGDDIMANGYRTVNRLKDILDSRSKAEKESLFDINKKLYERVLRAKETGMLGFPCTNIPDLNKNMRGAEGGNLIVIAARPGMGKSIFGTTVVNKLSIEGDKRGLFWSLEMTNAEQMERLVASCGQHTLSQLQTGNIEELSFERDLDFMRTRPIVMIDKAGRKANEVVAEIRRQHSEAPLDYIVVDHGGLIRTPNDGRNTSTKKGEISKAFKELAKELDIPVFLLWQLSRGVESRGGDRKPSLQDLRDSGEIEEDADKVIFINRPEYYGILEDYEGNPTDGLAYLDLAKCRGGIPKEVKATFKIRNAMFIDYERPGTYQSAFNTP